jgi:predicted RNA-binding protein with PUA-like domain
VPLAAVKADPRLAQMALVRLSRLSVQPVTPAEWAVMLALGGLGQA